MKTGSAWGVRLLGIWLLIECLQELVGAAQIHFGFLRPYQSTLPAYFLHAGVELAAGLYLLLGARSLVALVYKNDRPDVEEEPSARAKDRAD